MARKDLSNQRFGMLVVLNINEEVSKMKSKNNRHKTYWNCICDCGKTTVVETSHLTTGHTTSCGCLRRADLAGKTFGRLYVISKDEERSKNSKYVYWLCQCECGKTISVMGICLTKGTTVSCGCFRRELASKMHAKTNDIQLFEDLGFGKAYYGNSDNTFIFDIEDKDIVKSKYWYEDHNGYPKTKETIKGTHFLHRVIMKDHYPDLDNNTEIDHINHDVSNTRKENLRSCTRSENTRNTRSKGSNTGERNIYYDKVGNRYKVDIYIDKEETIKYFKTFEEAKKFRDNFFKERPDKFRYSTNIDRRGNRNNITIPFIDAITKEPIMREVINPFTIIDQNKFNGNKNK